MKKAFSIKDKQERSNLISEVTEKAKKLYEEGNVIVLPGSYLAVENKKINPGKGFVRIAIVHETEIIEQALTAVNKAYTEA